MKMSNLGNLTLTDAAYLITHGTIGSIVHVEPQTAVTVVRVHQYGLCVAVLYATKTQWLGALRKAVS